MVSVVCDQRVASGTGQHNEREEHRNPEWAINDSRTGHDKGKKRAINHLRTGHQLGTARVILVQRAGHLRLTDGPSTGHERNLAGQASQASKRGKQVRQASAVSKSGKQAR